MAKQKILFLDVDGTITNYENQVPESCKRAIRAARAAGHRVYMCTGRSKAENPPEITEIGFDGMVYGGELYRDDLNKVSFILSSYQDHLDSIEEFPDLECHTWGGAGETALFGDMGVKDISKAHAVNVVLEHLGADAADAYAFGDAKIDIPMFEACGTGVCVGSGGDEAKAAADYVTTAVDDDGIWNAFEHFGLMG